MEKENLYLIHGEDYLRHIEEKLELLWMATILMHYIKNGAEKDGYLDLVRRSTLDFDERCEEMFSSWGRALNYLKSRDLADLSDLIENDLIEPEYAGYVPADNPCCPGERCCEYAERIEREYAAEREADEDADVFEYDGEPAISELTGVCRDILIPYASVYGEIVEENGRLTTTGAKRTGCMFCMFGIHLEKPPNRFQRMALTHPKQYDFCIHKLGCGKVLDFLGVPYAPNGGETP